MKNSLIWVRSKRDYHDHIPEKLTPFCSSLIKQLGIDPDVSASGLPAPITVSVYTGYINDVNADILARQNSKSLTLTSDEIHKVGILNHATDAVVGYIDNAVNLKYTGDLVQITTVLARFGLKPAITGGKGHKHIFKVLAKGSCSATLQCPSFGPGSCYHWRWSADGVKWNQVKSTDKSTVIINDLPKDVRVYFQYDVSMPVGKGKYYVVNALATDYSWSHSISELIPA
jgi:hypothetical protein